MVIVNIAIVQKAQGDYKQVTKSYFEALTIYTKTKWDCRMLCQPGLCLLLSERVR